MASHTPLPIQNENIRIQAGKDGIGAKVNVPKSEQKGRKDRKALADISKSRKPTISTALKPSLKEKSVVRSNENVKGTEKINALKNSGLTEEQVKRCSEWAKEGIEHVNFSGNNLHTLQQRIDDERVEREVQSVMSALNGWIRLTYGPILPVKVEENEDFLELDPEVPLPVKEPYLTSDKGLDDPFLEEEEDLMLLRESYSSEFTLKEDDEHDAVATE